MNIYFNSSRYKHYSNYGVRKVNDNTEDNTDNSIDELCYCNPKNTKLDKLILSFSYLLTDCNKCFIDYGEYSDCEFDYEFDGNNEGTYTDFKTLIKKNPELVFIKNNFGLYPLELVELLFQTYIYAYNSYDTIRGFAKISLYYLRNIRQVLVYEYVKYELKKNAALRYIKYSNHIGNNGNLLQLPMEIWDHVFTFI